MATITTSELKAFQFDPSLVQAVDRTLQHAQATAPQFSKDEVQLGEADTASRLNGRFKNWYLWEVW